MPTKLSEKAIEDSTFAIKTDFTVKTDPSDEVGTPFTPNAGLAWSLTDKEGNIVNNRIDEPLTPAESVTIVLKGNDLALSGSPVRRYVIVRGTFNGVLGNNLPLIDEVSFQIENLKGARTLPVLPIGNVITPVVGTPSIGLI
jgi:hypothetical protein